MYQMWSWLLTAIGVTGLYLAGRKSKAGWAVGLGAQVLWLTYAITTRQWGFLVSAFAYGSVYVMNWRRWNRDGVVKESPRHSSTPPSGQTPVIDDAGENVVGPPGKTPPSPGSPQLGSHPEEDFGQAQR